MIKRILVGYDNSETARDAFRFALEMMRATGGHVYVLSVLQVTEGGADAGATMMTDQSEAHTSDLQAELARIAPDDGALYDAEVVYGSPGDVLLAHVEAHDIEHIVLGRTHKGGLLRWLLGSVSNDLIARARVPVTVMP